MSELLRKLRGGLGNALIWGASWTIGSVLLLTVFVLAGVVPAFPPLAGLLRIALRFGMAGVVVGAGFSGFLGFAFGNQRLSSIGAVPFILGGAVVSAVVSPFIGGSALIGALLGAGTAGVTLTAARRADRDALGAGDADRLLGG